MSHGTTFQRFRQAQADDRVPQQWPRDPFVVAALAKLDWVAMLLARPAWSWETDRSELRCPDGRTVSLTTVRPQKHDKGRTGIIFRRPAGGCEDCSSRRAPGCRRGG